MGSDCGDYISQKAYIQAIANAKLNRTTLPTITDYISWGRHHSQPRCLWSVIKLHYVPSSYRLDIQPEMKRWCSSIQLSILPMTQIRPITSCQEVLSLTRPIDCTWRLFLNAWWPLIYSDFFISLETFLDPENIHVYIKIDLLCRMEAKIYTHIDLPWRPSWISRFPLLEWNSN